ncbi:MAG: hypothetical protein ABJE95_25205, partial [Byssovorax sp.]
MRLRVCLLLVTLVSWAPERAFAQSEGEPSPAEEQFHQGREAFARGDYPVALRLFRSSQELDPGRGKLVNIALCEEKLGLVATAERHLREIVPLLEARDPRLAIVQQHLIDVGPRVPHLRVDLATRASMGATVTFDGAPLTSTTLGTEMAVEPGSYALRVNASGVPERRYDVVVEEGKSIALTVEPGVAVPPQPAARYEAPPAPSHRRQVGLVVGSTGMAALTAGTITGILALADRDAIESECPSRVGCSAAIVGRAAAGKSLSIVSAISLSAGAIGVGVGIYFVVSHRKSGGAAAAAPTAG